MKIKTLTIGDITSKSLLYYDEKRIQECLGICNYLKIDFLPLIGKTEYAERIGETYTIKKIEENISISEYKHLLTNEVREKLTKAKHNVVFVIEGQVIKGVLHISDLNKNIVLQALQHDLLTFERNLRQWFLLNEISNEQIISFFKERSNRKEGFQYWKRQFEEFESMRHKGELDRFGELQHFNLSHLLDFGNSSISNNLFSTKETVESNETGIEVRKLILELRNNAMHAKDNIDTKSDLQIHSVSSLDKLFKYLDTFISKFEYLESLIHSHSRHVKAIELDNASKLTIIGEHYPNAIEYFIK